jgi:hypothetical protein
VQVENLSREDYDALISEYRRRLETLRSYRELFQHPAWALLEQELDRLKEATLELLRKSKEANELFHLQGRLWGLEVLKGLPGEVRNEALDIQHNLARLEETPPRT